MSYPSERVRALRAKFGRRQWDAIASPGRHINYNPEVPLFGRGRYRVIENASRGLRVTEAGDGCGWYVDSYQSDTTVPHVVQMPARDGTPRYFAATSDPWNNDMFIVDMDACDDAREAGRYAVQLAGRYAEDCREDDARETARMQIQELGETIASNRTRVRALLAELRAARANLGPAICRELRARIADLRDENRKAHARQEALADNYWLAVQ